MSWKATDVTNDSKDSQIEFDVMVGDTLTQTVVINSGGINLPTSGDGYSIEGTNVLNATTLGSNVVTSSLTTVGTLNSGAISSGFGNIDIGSSSLDAGAITGTGLTLTGDIELTGQATDIDLIDNNSSALSFDASGKTGILNIVTTNSSEGVSMSGTLDVTGLSSLDGGIDVNGSNFAVNTSGQVTAGEWTGTTISVANGGTGATSLTSNAILTGNGSSAITAEGNLLFDGSDLTLYEATNNGNPSISVGSASAETLLIQSVYDSGAQTLDKVSFTTKASSGTADKGKMEFNVDESLIFTVDDGAINLATGKQLEINGTSVLNANTLGSGIVTSSLTTVGTLIVVLFHLALEILTLAVQH